MVMSGLDVFSVACNVVAILDAAIRLLNRLQKAEEIRNDIPSILKTHHRELQSIHSITKIIQDEEALQLDTIHPDLTEMDNLGNQLVKVLKALIGPNRGAVKQYTHQLLNGSKNLDELRDIMGGLDRVKSNLSIRIQVAHVGMTKSCGNAILFNCELVERINASLQQLIGEGWGLKIAELIRKTGNMQEDGTARISQAELESLAHIDDDAKTLVGDDDLDKGGRTTRVVVRNIAEGSIQCNAPIGDRGPQEVEYLVIKDNKAFKNSLQVNHGVAEDLFLEMMRIQLQGTQGNQKRRDHR